MKTLPFVALLTLAACRQEPEAVAVDRNAAMIQESLERQADNLEAMANNATDTGTADALDEAADRLDDAKRNVADAAKAAKHELDRR